MIETALQGDALTAADRFDLWREHMARTSCPMNIRPMGGGGRRRISQPLNCVAASSVASPCGRRRCLVRTCGVPPRRYSGPIRASATLCSRRMEGTT